MKATKLAIITQAKLWLKILMLVYLFWIASILITFKPAARLGWLLGLFALSLEWRHYLKGIERLSVFLEDHALAALKFTLIFNHPRFKIFYLANFGYLPLMLPKNASIQLRRFWQETTKF